MSPLSPEFLVCAAGFVAAVVNSIAGGGTMLTFPALMAAGLPPVLANTTSTVGLFLGMPGSVWAFRKRLAESKGWLWPLGIVSVLGGLAGAVLLLALPGKVFERLVPWLLLFATVLFMLNGPINRWLRRHAQPDAPEPQKPPFWALISQAGVALYGGYFGAGIGIIMLAGLGVIGLRDINRMNAMKNLLGALVNIAAVILFIARREVNWPLAAWLMGGSIPGYYLGARLAQKIPPVWVRGFVSVVGLAIAASLFLKN